MKPGDIIDEKYEVIRLLGEGGMGQVYEGRHVRIGRKVALKVLRPQHSTSPTLATRFLREAQAASAIGSDHIVDIYDVGDTPEGAPYLIMEFLEGESLHTLLDRVGRLDPGRACELMIQACRGVAAAHRSQIIHRDLKPDNLFLTSRDDGSERVKVVDFGIAKMRDSFSDEEPRLTATGAAVGTPYYMSPEQARADDDLDHRTDIYSLGVILYESLTGQLPFTARSFSELIIMIATSSPPPPKELQPDLPDALDTLVMKAMARHRNDRYESVEELAEDLKQFLPTPDGVTHIVEKTQSKDDEMAHALSQTCLSPTKDEPFEISGEHQSDLHESHGTSLAWQSAGGEAPEPPSRWRHGRLTALVFFVAIIAGGALWLVPGLTGEERTEAGAGAAASKSPARASTKLAGDAAGDDLDVSALGKEGAFLLEVRVEPPTAKLMIDGALAEKLPFVGSFPSDGKQLRLEASAEGFEPHTRYVTLHENRVVKIELAPVTHDSGAGSVDSGKVPSTQQPPAKKNRSKGPNYLLKSPYE